MLMWMTSHDRRIGRRCDVTPSGNRSRRPTGAAVHKRRPHRTHRPTSRRSRPRRRVHGEHQGAVAGAGRSTRRGSQTRRGSLHWLGGSHVLFSGDPLHPERQEMLGAVGRDRLLRFGAGGRDWRLSRCWLFLIGGIGRWRSPPGARVSRGRGRRGRVACHSLHSWVVHSDWLLRRAPGARRSGRASELRPAPRPRSTCSDGRRARSASAACRARSTEPVVITAIERTTTAAG